MIVSILDTDLYKFSTSYAYFSQYPLAEGTFKFNDRNKENWNEHPEFLEQMNYEFTKLQNLQLQDDECSWCIEHIPYIPHIYWEWLKSFRFNPEKIKCSLDENGVFQCEVTDYMCKVTLYEIAILATYAEVRNKVLGYNKKVKTEEVKRIIDNKIHYTNKYNLPFAEFGTRRRFSYYIQDTIIRELRYYSTTCVGTSNVHFAMKYDMVPSGTFPHEWVMFHAGVFGFKRANYMAGEVWINVYDGNLGTFLLDTYTTKSSLRTMPLKQLLLFNGFRQDSGDEFKIGNMVIKRLKEVGIDPKSKLIVFSNALDFEKYKEIHEYFNGRIKVSAGIGTNLTCDPGIEDYQPANIVMKLSKCRMSNKDPWEDVIKISDDLGKHMGNEKEFEIAKHELHLTD